MLVHYLMLSITGQPENVEEICSESVSPKCILIQAILSADYIITGFF